MSEDCRNLAERLQESEEMFRQLTEVNDQVFYLVSVDFKVMHYVSDSCEKVWERSRESLYENPLSWVDAVHPHDLEHVWAELATPRTGRREFQYRIVHKDGAVRWILARHGEIKDKSGVAQRLCGTALDITERKQTEEGLRRMARIIECSEEGIAGASLDGVIESWNPACERLLGYRADEILGHNITELCPPELHEEQNRLLDSVRGGKNIQQFETISLGKAGKPIDVSLSISQTIDREGRMVGFSSFYRNITQSRHLEAKLRQSQKMEGIGRLAGGIAHDFNNLLTGIMGYSRFLLESLHADDPNRHDVVEILRAGERAAALTRQLLAFSRQQVLTVKVLDVNAAIADLENMLRRIIHESITLTFRPGLDLGHVKAAPGQIEQILMNLCVNAKDAMEDGGKLLIETSNVGGEAGHCVLLTISDTGCGMTAHVLAHLFEPFFTTKEQGKGTGLGLSTVYGIVEQNGGSIEVDSEVGRGTTVNIYLPRCDAPLPKPQVAPAVHSAPPGKEVVLVVEDDESVGRFVGRVLKDQGYSVLSASYPSEALRICAEDPGSINLLLTDIVMPEMLGYELTRRATAIKPDLRVVFMSGYTAPSIVDRAALHGAAFLQKPMSAQDIATAVRTALDGPTPGATS